MTFQLKIIYQALEAYEEAYDESLIEAAVELGGKVVINGGTINTVNLWSHESLTVSGAAVIDSFGKNCSSLTFACGVTLAAGAYTDAAPRQSAGREDRHGERSASNDPFGGLKFSRDHFCYEVTEDVTPPPPGRLRCRRSPQTP